MPVVRTSATRCDCPGRQIVAASAFPWHLIIFQVLRAGSAVEAAEQRLRLQPAEKAGLPARLSYDSRLEAGPADELVKPQNGPPSSSPPLAHGWIRCLVPGFDGALFGQQWKDALWARFSTIAPARQRRFDEQYKIVKRA